MWLFFALLSCSEPYRGACEEYIRFSCEVCEQDDEQQVVCTCVENGTLAAGDYPSGYDVSNDEAAQACDEILLGITYPSPDTAASCKQAVSLLEDYDKDACKYVY